jgi:WD repeat and SOF domain-containing protein 1
MKVKVISRSQASTQRECIGDVRMEFRNLSPTYHPFHKAREYTRGVQAAKLDRMFAKPFVGTLDDGHADGITQTSTHRENLVQFVSGSVDGVVKLWDLPTRKCITTYTRAHTGVVSGLALLLAASGGATTPQQPQDPAVLSCGEDGYIRLWKMTVDLMGASGTHTVASSASTTNIKSPIGPASTTTATTAEHLGLLKTWRHPNTKYGGSFKSLDRHWTDTNQFATASDSAVDIWDYTRSSPIQSFSSHHTNLMGDGDTITVVRYNPVEASLLAYCSMDRGVGLQDVRTGSALRKTILAMRSNCLQWNPMEPYYFVVGNEDYNCYSFDMRKLSTPTMIHKGHVGAVLSVSWSPTGREFVSGSYDKTLRIFGHQKGTSREIYFTKRMQRIFTVNYTSDNTYIISGSDDTNLRLWKARASEKVGAQLTIREERSLQYREALVTKYNHLPEIHKIMKSGKRRGTKFVRKQTHLQQIQTDSKKRKLENRIQHSKPGAVLREPERSKVVEKELDKDNKTNKTNFVDKFNNNNNKYHAADSKKKKKKKLNASSEKK